MCRDGTGDREVEALFEKVLIEMLAVVAQLALLRLLAWLRERSSGAPEVATAH